VGLAIAMGYVESLRTDGCRYITEDHRDLEFLLEVPVVTEIVIAHEIDDLNAGLDDIVQGSEGAYVPRRNNGLVVEPIVKEIAHDKQMRRLVGSLPQNS
jgi:hypothetical protein